MAKPDLNIFPQNNLSGKKIGLLGGSFNPAHAAHLEISLVALEKLKLDAVWWLVSPQNPLKSDVGMASLEERLARARAMSPEPRIYVTDLEEKMAVQYTVDTVTRITSLLPDTQFVWLMGADNLAEFSKWKDWKKIAQTVVFAIFDRPGYSTAVETSDAAAYFLDKKIPSAEAADLCSLKPPAWTFIRDTKNPLSSTKIRRKKL
ncbi:Nicotinate-nucleotide adenylyltransferase [hydrothermal vent metagenome]|uniref:Nicotinate-nucleotide adenylyltransferase n=1 Tax=hydrothermal vent metagenome TaxID=652676 RepID=A0A3B1AHV1_9ZZZZ